MSDNEDQVATITDEELNRLKDKSIEGSMIAQAVGSRRRIARGMRASNSSRAQLIAYLAAAGLNHRQIAEQVGLKPASISRYLAMPRVKELVSEKAFEMFGKGAQERFMRILPKAMDTAEQIMEDPEEKGSVRAEIAFKFMDRALGKAIQQTEHNVGGVRQLIEKFDELTSRMTIEVKPRATKRAEVIDTVVVSEETSSVGKESEHEDEIDAWVAGNLKK